MDGPWGHYAKWNKSDREEQTLYDLTSRWNIKKKHTKTELVDKDRLGLPDAGVGRTAKMGEGVKIVKRLKKKKCPVTR